MNRTIDPDRVTAEQVMTSGVVRVVETTPITEIIELIRARKFTGIPVADRGGRIVGIVSQKDVLCALSYLLGTGDAEGCFDPDQRKTSVDLVDTFRAEVAAMALVSFLQRPVSAIMTPMVEVCSPTTSLSAVCSLMASRSIHRVVVQEPGGEVVGIISSTDVVKLLAGRR